MAALDVGARDAPLVHADELDDLFDYDVGDVFRDIDTNMQLPAKDKEMAMTGVMNRAAGLGIDEEIKVMRKRAPIAKLDEKRLLSPAGIPKLKRLAQGRLKFKGKGHEYSDVARLLNVYQLWLDELFPRAKVVDGLAIIEKIGHSKRLQTMRKEWINQHKQNKKTQADPAEESDRNLTSQQTAQDQVTALIPKEGLRTLAEANDSDLYATTPRHNIVTSKTETETNLIDELFISEGGVGSGEPQDDDLERLLADAKAPTTTDSGSSPMQNRCDTNKENEYADDMEAIAELDNIW